jgi:hypothetical protein
VIGLYVDWRANLQVVQRLVRTHGQMLGVARGRAGTRSRRPHIKQKRALG